MILSASRRTDIPSCYAEWFMNRIREGFIMVQNPINPRQVRRVNLSPQSIDCIVFWTKNALPLMPYLDELDDRGYRYIFQYTFTPYGTDIERNLTSKDSILKNMTDLATRIGKNRLIWRYDPICLNEKYSVDFHITSFGTLCQNLHRDVHHAVISFMDSYRKNGTTSLMGPDEEQARYLCSEFGRIAARHQIEIKTCCESWNLEEFGIGQGACIDEVLLNQVCRYPLSLKKAKGQRAGCLCRESIDIGTYNTCTNGCIYCYATDSRRLKKTIGSYRPDSPLLCGTVNGLGNGAHHHNQGKDLFQ